jgi:hypothetical protein
MAAEVALALISIVTDKVGMTAARDQDARD